MPTPADSERLLADLWQLTAGRGLGLFLLGLGERVMLGVQSPHPGVEEAAASLIADQCGGAVEELPALASQGAGRGVLLMSIVQDFSQLRARYGADRANSILNNHGCKMVLPGISDPETTEVVAKLVGRSDFTDVQVSHNDGRASRSYSLRQDQLAPPDALRQLQEGTGIVLYRGKPPTIVRLRPWYADRRLGELVRRQMRGN